MSDFVNTNNLSINCNFGKDFKDLLISLLSHSKIDLKINKIIHELQNLIYDSDETTLLKYENLLMNIHRLLDKKTSNCDRMIEHINKNMNYTINLMNNSSDGKESPETNSSSDLVSRVVIEKQQKIINSTNERRKHLTKRDKSRRSLRIITQSKAINNKSISKFSRSSLSRYHHQLHCSTSSRRRGLIENNISTGTSKKNNKENCYCICKKGAYGKMIACDNSACKIEWFHNKCVKVIDVPNGEWFCPACRLNYNKD